MSQPEIVFRHGSCSAYIFENEYKRGDDSFAVKSVNFQRAYLDRKGEWQHSSNLNLNDLPKAVLVLNKAYEYLTSNGRVEEETVEEE